MDDYLIVRHLQALPADLFTAEATKTVPFAMVPLNLYLRNGDFLGRIPECEPLEDLADRIRLGGGGTVRLAVEALHEVFQKTWEHSQVEGGKLEPRRERVAHDNYDWKTHRSGAGWDRVITPKYTLDVAELNGRKLSYILGQPYALAAEIVKKTAEARARQAELNLEITGYELVTTPPRLHLKVESFILESFSWFEAAGKFFTKPKEAVT
jgi:hypothetical protein